MFKGSWKTLAAGIFGGIVLIGIEAFDFLKVPVQGGNGIFEVQNIAAGLTALGIGWFARDNDVKSETVGAK